MTQNTSKVCFNKMMMITMILNGFTHLLLTEKYGQKHQISRLSSSHFLILHLTSRTHTEVNVRNQLKKIDFFYKNV